MESFFPNSQASKRLFLRSALLIKDVFMDYICNVYFSIGLKNKEWFVSIQWWEMEEIRGRKRWFADHSLLLSMGVHC